MTKHLVIYLQSSNLKSTSTFLEENRIFDATGSQGERDMGGEAKPSVIFS